MPLGNTYPPPSLAQHYCHFRFICSGFRSHTKIRLKGFQVTTKSSRQPNHAQKTSPKSPSNNNQTFFTLSQITPFTETQSRILPLSTGNNNGADVDPYIPPIILLPHLFSSISRHPVHPPPSRRQHSSKSSSQSSHKDHVTNNQTFLHTSPIKPFTETQSQIPPLLTGNNNDADVS